MKNVVRKKSKCWRALGVLPALGVFGAALLFGSGAVQAQGAYRGETTDVQIEKLPATPEEFIALRDKIATTPQGGAAAFVVALLKYAEEPKSGEAFLTIAIDGKWLVNKSTGYKGKTVGPRYLQALKMRIADKPYVARSYVQGTTPENGYALPEFPLTIKVLEQAGDAAQNAKNAANGGLVKVFVYSTGADSPRPMQVNKNDKGIWKAYSWSSLEVGVRPPVQETKDDI
jgi:hypothetical protein